MTNPTPTPQPATPVAWCRTDDFRDALLKRQSFSGWREPHPDCDMALYAQPQASHPVAADQVEGPSLADVDELCAEFGFYCNDDSESLSILRDMITAAITRWPLTTEPVADPLQSEALLEIRPADAPVTQETVLLDKGSGLMAFGMGHLGAFPAPQQSAAPPAIDISDKIVAGIRAVVLGLARSASPDTLPAAQPVSLAELHDPDFSDGLTPSQHLDVVHGGVDPRATAAASPGLPPRAGHILRLAEIIREVDLQSHSDTFVLGEAALAEAILAHPGFSGCHDGPAAPAAQGEVDELVAALEADAECVAAEQPDLMQLTDKQLTRIAQLLKSVFHA